MQSYQKVYNACYETYYTRDVGEYYETFLLNTDEVEIFNDTDMQNYIQRINCSIDGCEHNFIGVASYYILKEIGDILLTDYKTFNPSATIAESPSLFEPTKFGIINYVDLLIGSGTFKEKINNIQQEVTIRRCKAKNPFD
jgi:hypothetical protein